MDTGGGGASAGDIDPAAVPKSTVTTADDLIVATGNAAVTRLAVGASRIIGKKASGGLAALTAAETAAILVPSPVAITQTFATADPTLAAQTAAAVAATAATNVAPYGYAQAQADAIVANLNALRVDHLDLASVVNSVVDALQAAGLLA